MPSRTITDAGGRVWQCQQLDSREKRLQTQDVRIECTTITVSAPVRLTVGWEWHNMADTLLARLITNVAPVPSPR